MLRKIQPFVIDKKEQVKIALEAMTHQHWAYHNRYVSGCYGTQPLSEEILEYRKSLWLKMKSLNSHHKSCAAATTKPSDSQPERCDSLALRVIAGGGVA